MKFKVILAVLLFLGFVSCRKEMPRMQNPNNQVVHNWNELFESYWNGMNYHYVFWDIDSTDWDKVYDEYKPKFQEIAKLGFKDIEVNDRAVEWIKDMSASLIDQHLQITISLPGNEKDRVYALFPPLDNLKKREGYHELLLKERLDALIKMHNEGRWSGPLPFVLSDEEGNNVRYYSSCLIDNKIAYLGFSKFFFSQDLSNQLVYQIFEYYYDMLDNNSELKGVIIDLRGNYGGYLNDLKWVLGKFVKEPLKFCYTRKKNGLGRLDFTPYTPEYLYPFDYKRELNIPVVVLADMNSISMAEITTLAVMNLPGGNGVFIGEQTWGGNGNLNPDFDYTYGGQFSNQKLNVSTCMSSLVDINKVSYEGRGIKPDIELPLDVEKLINEQIDNQLEYAINYINSK